MKICLVTAFPPSQGGLSEYGLHIAEELRRNPFLSLTILADRLSPPFAELDGFSVQRCWSFENPASPVRILKALRELKPDVVWFNLLFSTFGRNPVNAFLGLLTPLLARLSGQYTHVTLHHLMDTVDLKDAGVSHPRAYRWAGSVATRLLLLSNSVSVLMPGYRKILTDKYGRDNVHVRSHGILTRRPEYPEFARRGNPEQRILAFGKWGTYKRLELIIQAFEIVAGTLPNTKLVIGGGDHPQAHGYVESVKNKFASSEIEFTDYVREDELANLFQQSTVAVMPYSSSTGSSGVAHLACAYGVPIVCADLPDFRQMAEGEELAIDFYQPGDAQDLAACLIRMLTDTERQQAMGLQNFSTALRMTMPAIVQKYLRHFELEQRVETLRQVTRFRRLPGWVPSRSLLLRMMTRNSQGWVHRSALHQLQPKMPGRSLLNRDVNRGSEIPGAGTSMNGDGVARRSAGIADDVGFGSGAVPAASNGCHSNREQGDEGQDLHSAPAPPNSGQSEARDSQRQKQSRREWESALRSSRVQGSNGIGRNGESGTGTPGAGRNDPGSEPATQAGGQPAASERDAACEAPGSGFRPDRKAS